MMLTHINKFGSLFDAADSSLDHIFGLADKCNNSTIGSLTRIDIQKAYTATLHDLRSNGIYNSTITSLAEIGDTFNDLFHFCKER